MEIHIFRYSFRSSIVATHDGSHRYTWFVDLGDGIETASSGVFRGKIISNSVRNDLSFLKIFDGS